MSEKVVTPASPLPWRVGFAVDGHYKGSPACLATCGQGQPVQSVSQASDPWVNGETEVHHVATEWVDDIVAADGSHAVCFGHDYNDGGLVGDIDARFIVLAVNNHHALIDALTLVCDTAVRLGCSRADGGDPEIEALVAHLNAIKQARAVLAQVERGE